MRGILFDEPTGMFTAVITGRKTNTRREGSLAIVNDDPDHWKLIANTDDHRYNSEKTGRFWFTKPNGSSQCFMSRFRKGDIVYVQEPYMDAGPHLNGGEEECIIYRYPDHNGALETETFAEIIKVAMASRATWNNKYFMPEKYARYFVQITDVRVERLGDISEADCFAEGIQRVETGGVYPNPPTYSYDGNRPISFSPKNAYFDLFWKINGKPKPGRENPWLFSYHFKLVPKPELGTL